MAIPVTLFFRGNRKYGIGRIKFDLIINETHNFSNLVTTHDIEDGSQITDHIRNELENGVLTGLITNFSIAIFGLFSNRAQDAFNAIYELWKSRTLVTITTVMGLYKNVAILSVDVNRSEGTGEAVMLSISFQKIRQVKLQTVTTVVKIDNMNNNTNRQAAGPTNTGRAEGSHGASGGW